MMSEGEEGGDEQAADHDNRHRRADFGGFADAQGDGQHADNRGRRGH